MTVTLNLQFAIPKSTDFPTRVQFKNWVSSALKKANFTLSAELTIRIVDLAEGAELNSTYRKKSGPTNVLSFPFETMPGIEENYLGDLVICAPVVLKEAAEQSKPILAHWAHLTVHGVLHLLGYDHELDEQAAEMEALEVEILRRLGVENPY